MITKAKAKAAWQTIMIFSVSNSDKTSFSKSDVTLSLQEAIKILNEYFTQPDNEGEQYGK